MTKWKMSYFVGHFGHQTPINVSVADGETVNPTGLQIGYYSLRVSRAAQLLQLWGSKNA